jgi:hypothetical protein
VLVPEDTFVNGEVHGSTEWTTRLASLGIPVRGLSLDLSSDLTFDYLTTANLSRLAPPTYEWSFGDVAEGSEAGADVALRPTPERFNFTPGFDASRSFDETEFSAPGVQTLTITVTPRAKRGELVVRVRAEEDAYVTPVITSPTSGDHHELSRDGHELTIYGMPVEVGVPLVISVTIGVIPKVAEIEFMASVWVGWRETLDSGAVLGSSVSRTDDALGTRTWTAEGEYSWQWEAHRSYAVRWLPTSRGTVAAPNRVFVGFAYEVDYRAPGDTFTNGEVSGHRLWRITSIINIADETGKPVSALKVAFASDLAFDGLSPYPPSKMGPPVYEWTFGDLVEEPEYRGWSIDAIVMMSPERSPTTITPGFDASRSFDQTVFSAPGTQTVTVTVTPREQWLKRITVFVHAAESDLVDPVVLSYTSPAGGEVSITPDGHFSGISNIPVELDTAMTLTVILRITPKVPGVEYKPRVAVLPDRPSEHQLGSTSGGFLSVPTEVGTWIVSAEGDYTWDWTASRSLNATLSFAEGARRVASDE